MEVKVKDLTKSYKNQIVLNIEEIIFESGKINSIMGSNGSGKSTLMNIIAGLMSDYEGEVSYEGRKIDKKIRGNMTMVFQKPYLMRMTVYENLEYPLKIRKIERSKRQELVDHMLCRMGIENLKNQRANNLSGGEGQKVSIGRAMIFEPKLLLLDEPTASIDKEYTKIIENEIKKYNKETNATVIMITHSLNQAENISDKIIHLEKGKVEK